MKVDRGIEPALSFDRGVKDAEYALTPQGQTPGVVQKTLLPGSTTVSEALNEVFPEGQHIEGEIMRALVAGNSMQLRTERGFSTAARKAIRSLRGRKTKAAESASRELEGLLADTELLNEYRAALLES